MSRGLCTVCKKPIGAAQAVEVLGGWLHVDCNSDVPARIDPAKEPCTLCNQPIGSAPARSVLGGWLHESCPEKAQASTPEVKATIVGAPADDEVDEPAGRVAGAPADQPPHGDLLPRVQGEYTALA